MQIREKKGHFYFLRARWDKEKRRSVQDLIGSGDRYGTLKLHDAVTFSDEEQAQWDTHLKGILEASRASLVQGTVKHFLPLLENFHRTFLANTELLDLETVQAQRAALRLVAKDLKKHARKLRAHAENVVSVKAGE